MLKDYIGGEALRNGIIFFGLTNKVTGTLQQGKDVVLNIEKQKKSRQFFAKIPVIRGITIFYPFIFLYYCFVTYPAVRPVAIIAVTVMLLWQFKKSSREYHGEEHMAANAYMAGLDITNIDNIKQQSMLSRRCGSVFLILFVLLSFLMWPVTVIPAWITALLLPGITYEIHTAEKDTIIIRAIMKVALLFQRFVVASPSVEQLQLTSQTLSKLIECEEKTNQEQNKLKPAKSF